MTDRDLRNHDSDADPLLDAFLAEALGNESPPDLTDRILRAFAAQNSPAQNSATQDAAAAGSLLPPLASSQTSPSSPIPAPAGSASASRPQTHHASANGAHRLTRASGSRRPGRPWRTFAAPLAVAATLLVAMVGYWIVFGQRDGRPHGDGERSTAAANQSAESPAGKRPAVDAAVSPSSATNSPQDNSTAPATSEDPTSKDPTSKDHRPNRVADPPAAPVKPQPREFASNDPSQTPTENPAPE